VVIHHHHLAGQIPHKNPIFIQISDITIQSAGKAKSVTKNALTCGEKSGILRAHTALATEHPMQKFCRQQGLWLK
jgi:hypothetical protein